MELAVKMKDILICTKRVLWQLLISVIILAIILWQEQQMILLNGVLAGFIASLTYFYIIGKRLFKSTELELEKAVIYMRAGWFIRLSILVLIFILSIRISTAMFWAAVAGLVWVNVVVLINAVIYAYQKKMHENK